MTDRRGATRGQATVELVLVLPVVVLALLLVIQVGLIARDQVLVVNAAREGAGPPRSTVPSAAAAGGAGPRPGLRAGRPRGARGRHRPGAGDGDRDPVDGPLPGAHRRAPGGRRCSATRRSPPTVTMRVEEPGDRSSVRSAGQVGGAEEAGGGAPCRAARCSCRTWATARSDGQPSPHAQRSSTSRVAWQVAVGELEAQLGDAGAAGVAVVDHDRRGRPVSSSHGVDTPPTSQRSQMVNSGRMPMAACSAACSVPGHLGLGDARLGAAPSGGIDLPERRG